MKNLGYVFLVTIVLFAATNAQAVLVQGSFSGNIDYQRTSFSDVQLNIGTPFTGQFVYETDVVASSPFDVGGMKQARIPNTALKKLSFSLLGDVKNYTYSLADKADSPEIHVTYGSNGRYLLDIDLLPGQANFIDGLRLRYAELFLKFDNTFVTNAASPLIMPDANNLDSRGFHNNGSVLFMWVGNTQLNGNITTLSLQPQVQPVPEPATAILVFCGILCLVYYRKSRKVEC